MTEVTKWRDPLAKRFRPPLPEPPRYRHVSKIGRPSTDRTGRALDEWLRDVAVSTTIDAD